MFISARNSQDARVAGTLLRIVCAGCVLLAGWLASSHGQDRDQAPLELWAFHADDCSPCRRMQPRLKEVADRGGIVRIIDVDEYADLADYLHISRTPTYLLVRDRRVLERGVGMRSTAVMLRALEIEGSGRRSNNELGRSSQGSASVPMDMAPPAPTGS